MNETPDSNGSDDNQVEGFCNSLVKENHHLNIDHLLNDVTPVRLPWNTDSSLILGHLYWCVGPLHEIVMFLPFQRMWKVDLDERL